MKRIQLFEFEDYAWFPTWMRACMTNLIVVLHRLTGTGEAIIALIKKARKEAPFSQIVDMGSGSGGAMPHVVREMNAGGDSMRLLMTDLHPSPSVVAEINRREEKGIRYHPESLDATDLRQAPAGLKMMVNSFHHLPPHAAQKVIQAAEESRQPLLVYEMANNKVPTAIWWLMLPLSFTVTMLMAFFLTPFARPLTWQQLVFTYLIPIIPICYAWDGQASYVRMYALKDLEAMVGSLEKEHYRWEIGEGKKANGKKMGSYLLGLPT